MTNDIALRVSSITITSQASYDLALALATEIKAMRKAVENSFRPTIDLAHKAHKEAIAAMKSHDQPLEQAEKQLNTVMVAWVKAEQARVAEENRKREEEVRAHSAANDTLDMENEAPEAPVHEVNKGNLTTREVWKFEVSDLAQIPREFMIPDMARIGERVRALKDEAALPGIRVYSETVGYAR